MEPTNTTNTPKNPPVQAFVAAPTPVPPPALAPDAAKNAGTIHPTSIFGILILILVGMVVVSWFAPVPAGCGGRAGSGPLSCSYALPALLSTPIMILSALVGLGFLATVVSSTKGKIFFVQLFGVIIGLCGGFFLFTVGMIAGFFGSVRATGSV